MLVPHRETAMEKLTLRLEPSQRIRVVFEGISYVLFALLTLFQLGLLDYYFILYDTNKNKVWCAWVAGDLLVVVVLVWLLIIAVRYNHRCFTKNQCDDANIKYAWCGWLVYSLVLTGKIAVFIRLFGTNLDTTQTFGKNVYSLNLSISALIFLLLVLSHHYTQLNSRRQLYLAYLESTITLDILDSIQFLSMLYNQTTRGRISDELQISILFFACLNFVLPTFALLRLRYHKLPRWVPIGSQEMYTLVYFVMVNLPFLVIRGLTYRGREDGEENVTTFLVKNVIMIFLGAREFYLSLLKRNLQLREEKRLAERSVPL